MVKNQTNEASQMMVDWCNDLYDQNRKRSIKGLEGLESNPRGSRTNLSACRLVEGERRKKGLSFV